MKTKVVTPLYGMALAVMAPSLHAEDRVLLDFNMQTLPPANWAVEGYAFGTHNPTPAERQKQALGTRNQRYVQKGRMTSPEFTIESDYLKIDCAGTYHPTEVAVVLMVDGKDQRSCSPEPGYGFLGAKLPSPRMFIAPDPGKYFFDVRNLRGKQAVLEVRDQHYDGLFFDVKITATDQGPANKQGVITKAVNWVEDHFETKIRGDYLLVPVGPLVGTPLQRVTVEIEGEEKLSVHLPLAFGEIKTAGYEAVYDLTHYQGRPLKVTYHRFAKSEPAKLLTQRNIPGRDVSDHKPAFHVYNRIGMLNDPNGLVYYNDEWHLFHQFGYNLSHTDWKHYVSKDLMHWEERPIALFHDAQGCMFSGSAVVDVLNTSGWGSKNEPALILAYTSSSGNAGWKENDQIQTQCLAYSTDGGRNFIKYEGNPVLGHEQHIIKNRPKDSDTRDPKILWFSPTKGRDVNAKDGHWVMVLFERKGHTIYTSPDLKAWTKTGDINGFHECPELFPLAVDGDPENVKWIMYGARSRYHIGAFDGKTFKPETKKQTAMYYGDKCYASQTFNNTEKGPDGQPRRIQTMWQGGRFGQLSLPVELTLKTTPLGRRVCMLPVAEIANLRTDSVELDGLTINPGMANPLAGHKSGLYDIKIEADLSESSEIELNVRGNRLVIASQGNGLTLGKMNIPGSKKLFLRLVVDSTSQDIFFGEHGAFYSPRMVRPTSDKALSIAVKGGTATFSKLQVHQLKSIW
ncbi:MAG: glycoside hydrolase family 32 protein [Verrucomicrobia bacterium]|nr:glycoside hydrolase family 32 protein [Verrucomicrobiota bacterium]